MQLYTFAYPFFPAERYQYPSVYIFLYTFWPGCNSYNGSWVALMITLGAFYLVTPATLDDRVCPAHNRCLFPPLLFPIIFSLFLFLHDHCTKVMWPLALDDSCYAAYDPHALYNALLILPVSHNNSRVFLMASSFTS